MKKNHLLGFLMITLGIAMLEACSSSQFVVDETILLAYCKEPSQANLENLSKNYGTLINKTRKTGLKQPGIYSDYAVSLVKQGRRAEANSWFNREISEFASSRNYVMQLKRILIPEFINDNNIKIDDTEGSDNDALSPTSRAAAEERAASVMDKKEENKKNNK
jgi:hypothetical protein